MVQCMGCQLQLQFNMRALCRTLNLSLLYAYDVQLEGNGPLPEQLWDLFRTCQSPHILCANAQPGGAGPRSEGETTRLRHG